MSAPLTEEAIGDEYNAPQSAGDLPTRGLLECTILEVGVDGPDALRDLECLDAEEPPRLAVVGKLVKLTDEGLPVLPAAPDLEPKVDVPAEGKLQPRTSCHCHELHLAQPWSLQIHVPRSPRPNQPQSLPIHASHPPGPLARLDISEWSVEYDELVVTIWVSTEKADYKLISAAPEYLELWQTLQLKTVRGRLLLV